MVNKNVRYPGGHAKKTYKPPELVKNRKKANLGKELEGYLEATNTAYNMRKQAIVFRQNPEVTVIRKGKEIVSAFHKEKAGLDFIGLSSGRSFTFDTKETQSATSFEIRYLEDHQYETMQQFTDQGGLAFLLIRFVKKQRIYFVPLDKLAPWWIGAKGDGRKSIPFDWIHENCEIVGAGGGLAVDYLPLIKNRRVEKENA